MFMWIFSCDLQGCKELKRVDLVSNIAHNFFFFRHRHDLKDHGSQSFLGFDRRQLGLRQRKTFFLRTLKKCELFCSFTHSQILENMEALQAQSCQQSSQHPQSPGLLEQNTFVGTRKPPTVPGFFPDDDAWLYE